ncbi:hypothetical protein ACQEVF_49750 [Nonomuraea polychroma]|uniref:hypothetical protein n=1 Tax=Nonomuraea polychroma TaxID=46176 RepID=UPI003D92A69E
MTVFVTDAPMAMAALVALVLVLPFAVRRSRCSPGGRWSLTVAVIVGGRSS